MNVFVELGAAGLDSPVMKFLMALGFIIFMIIYYKTPRVNKLVKI